MDRPLRNCSPDNWRTLLIAMNKPDDEVEVASAALVDVVECHQRKGGFASRDMVVKERRSHCTVRRSLLWELVQQHGAICELKERPLV